METEQQNEETGEVEESVVDGLLTTFKPFLLGIGIIAFLMSIWVLLPMFLTYLSEGDTRPPSQIHPTDSAIKSGHVVPTNDNN